jgi:hypothetical protein
MTYFLVSITQNDAFLQEMRHGIRRKQTHLEAKMKIAIPGTGMVENTIASNFGLAPGELPPHRYCRTSIS